MKIIIKLLIDRVLKSGKITSASAVIISGLIHNLFPNAPQEVFAIVDAICGALLVSKDKVSTNDLPAN